MQVVDAQVHIWGANTPEHPWPKDHIKPHRDVPFLMDDLLAEMDAAGVNRAVLVPPMWQGDSNDYALQAARSHPQRFAVMGRIDLESPASRGLIAGWRRQPGMLGIRIVPRRQPLRTQFADRRVDWLWVEAAKAGVPLMALIDTDQTELMAEVATRHPDLKIILDHLCLPSGAKDDKAFAELDKVLALAKYPNVAVKASSLPSITTDGYPFLRIHPYIRRVYDAYGPRRMFWGTDLTHIPCTYKQAAGLFTDELPWLTAEDKEWIMGRGICEWLGWK
jgi:predicted TIM-barrel fold metal-dependent hydrolase